MHASETEQFNAAVAKGTAFLDQKTKVIRRVEPKKYPPKAQTTLYPQQSM
jgi:hypothetical protein